MPLQGTRTDIAEVMTYAKEHTESQCWEKYPVFMFRYSRNILRYKAAIVTKQKARPQVTVFWGKTGTGKSWKAMMMASNGEDDIFGTREFWTMSTPTSSTNIPWIDGYVGEEDVIIEDFAGEIYYRILLRMLDQYQNTMQVKGGMAEFSPKRIWITSNVHPKDWYIKEAWEGGPLHRRLVLDSTGSIEKLRKVYKKE